MMSTDTDALVQKLRYMGQQYAAGQASRGGSPRKHYLEEAADTIERLTRERDDFKQTLYDEMDGNLRLRELGKARPDEPMTPFVERLTRERDEAVAAIREFLEFQSAAEGPTIHEWARWRRVADAATTKAPT
jgi:hypothetical protein